MRLKGGHAVHAWIGRRRCYVEVEVFYVAVNVGWRGKSGRRVYVSLVAAEFFVFVDELVTAAIVRRDFVKKCLEFEGYQSIAFFECIVVFVIVVVYQVVNRRGRNFIDIRYIACVGVG